MVDLLVWTALALAGAAGPQGWRYDGSGAWPTDTPPTTWSAESVQWATTLPSWSNASPVVAGDLVCVNQEPTTLVCLDRATGAVRWTADNPILATASGEERAEMKAAIDRLDAIEAELRELRKAYSKLLRKARSGGEAVTAELEAMSKRTDALEAEAAAIPDYRTPPTQGMVGWSSPTPATDSERLFVLYANGVVSGYAHDGTQLWTRWLGPMPDKMLGWDEGHAASPVYVGDTLVVPFRQLQGLDPDTGATRWTGEDWPHYGAPTPTTIGDTPVVITPSGRIYRVSDGAVLAEGLADMWYMGPVVDGGRVYFLEARSDKLMRDQGGIDLVAVALGALDGDTLATETLWTTRIPASKTFYAAPVVAGGQVHAVTHAGTLWTVDATTGALQGSTEVSPLQPSVVYASPTAAGGHLFVTNEQGQTAVLTAAPRPEIVHTNALWPTRSSLAFMGDRLYVRTQQRLAAVPR